jgi:hypothetical protein
MRRKMGKTRPMENKRNGYRPSYLQFLLPKAISNEDGFLTAAV